LNSIDLPIITEEDHNWTGDETSPMMEIVCRVDSTRVIEINLNLEGSKVEMGYVLFRGKGADVVQDFDNNRPLVNTLYRPSQLWFGSEVSINEADAPQGIRGIRLALADVLLWVAACNSAFHYQRVNSIRFQPAKVPRELRRIFRAAGLLVEP
jgi:hypothetical protein